MEEISAHRKKFPHKKKRVSVKTLSNLITINLMTLKEMLVLFAKRLWIALVVLVFCLGFYFSAIFLYIIHSVSRLFSNK